MFEKIKLKAQIKRSKLRIEEIERKRERSQAALIQSIVRKEEPTDEDADYFNKFTDQINAERNHLRRLTKRLESLENNMNKQNEKAE